jgi:HPt (histidine-containing phosphotransfer) domain-containing protein
VVEEAVKKAGQILGVPIIRQRFEGKFGVYVKIAAHTFKGVLANMYVPDIAKMAQGIEHMAKNGEFVQALEAIEPFTVEVKRLVVELQALLDGEDE